MKEKISKFINMKESLRQRNEAKEKLLTLARGLFKSENINNCLVGVQHIDHTVRGALSHPAPQGRWAQQLRKIPESCVRRMHKAPLRTLRQHRQTYGERNAEGCNEARRPSCSATQILISRSDCHLPAMESADRRLRALRETKPGSGFQPMIFGP